MSIVAGKRLCVEIGSKKYEITSYMTNREIGKLTIRCSKNVMDVFGRWFGIAVSYINSEDYEKSVICKDITIGDTIYKNCLVSGYDILSEENDWCEVVIGFDYIEDTTPLSNIDKETATKLMLDLF